MAYKTEIRALQLKDLQATEGNPNTMTDKAFTALVKSMQKKGWYMERPTVWLDGDKYKIVSGHKRIRAALVAGITEAPCNVIIDPAYNEKQHRLDLLEANNRRGDDDKKLLTEYVRNLLREYPDEDLAEETGIDKNLLSSILAEPDEADDAVPENVPTRSATGDIYILGRHRVMCGDSSSVENMKALTEGKPFDMVFTDPPYGVSIGDKNKFLNTFQPSGRCLKNIEHDTDTKDDLNEILTKIFSLARENSADHCTFYVTSPQGGELGMMMMMMTAGLPVRHVLNWCKNSPTFSMGRLDYDYQHEPIFYTWKKNHKFYGKGEFKTSTWMVNKPRECKLHPTMKPVELIVNAVLNSTEPGMIVGDPFLGSGSTLIACEKTGRVCYGMELDPHYCDVIVQRYIDHVGSSADCYLVRGGEKTAI